MNFPRRKGKSDKMKREEITILFSKEHIRFFIVFPLDGACFCCDPGVAGRA
jgi:hypothetical protein